MNSDSLPPFSMWKSESLQLCPVGRLIDPEDEVKQRAVTRPAYLFDRRVARFLLRQKLLTRHRPERSGMTTSVFVTPRGAGKDGRSVSSLSKSYRLSCAVREQS